MAPARIRPVVDHEPIAVALDVARVEVGVDERLRDGPRLEPGDQVVVERQMAHQLVTSARIEPRGRPFVRHDRLELVAQRRERAVLHPDALGVPVPADPRVLDRRDRHERVRPADRRLIADRLARERLHQEMAPLRVRGDHDRQKVRMLLRKRSGQLRLLPEQLRDGLQDDPPPVRVDREQRSDVPRAELLDGSRCRPAHAFELRGQPGDR